jgi:hypothetical protein
MDPFRERTDMTEPTYRVVWPLGRSTSTAVESKPRIADLRGKTIAHLSHGGFRDQEIRPIVEEVLAKRYPDIRFVSHDVFGNFHDARNGPAVLASLPEKFAEHGVDAVITGIGS